MNKAKQTVYDQVHNTPGGHPEKFIIRYSGEFSAEILKMVNRILVELEEKKNKIVRGIRKNGNPSLLNARYYRFVQNKLLIDRIIARINRRLDEEEDLYEIKVADKTTLSLAMELQKQVSLNIWLM